MRFPKYQWGKRWLKNEEKDAQRGQNGCVCVCGTSNCIVDSANLPGILLNAILRNFSDAVEKGSKLKFIMYSAVSLLFSYMHQQFSKLVFHIFLKTLWCFVLFFLAWFYTHHPPGSFGRIQRPSSSLRRLSALWVLPGVWWVMTSFQFFYLSLHIKVCYLGHTQTVKHIHISSRCIHKTYKSTHSFPWILFKLNIF